MMSWLYLAVLALSMQLCTVAQVMAKTEKEVTCHSKECDKEKKECCCGPCCCVKKLKTFPVTIKKSGNYCLCEDVQLSNGQVGITIKASNVNLDLCSFKITGGCQGIEVAGGLSNIKIHNGSIQATQAEAIYVNSGCKAIEIEDLSAIACNKDQICAGLGSIVFNGISTCNITQCLLKDIVVSKGFGTAYALLNCNSCLITDCIAADMLSTPFLDVIGFHVVGNATVVQACKAINFFAGHQGHNAFGFFADRSKAVSFTDCESMGHLVSSDSGAEAVGFLIQDCDCAVVDDCIANQHNEFSVEAIPPCGTSCGFISRSSRGSVFRESSACGNGLSLDPYLCFLGGFALIDDSLSCIADCIALDNNGSGFYISSASTQCVVQHCKALSNSGYGFTRELGSVTNQFLLNFGQENGQNYDTDLEAVPGLVRGMLEEATAGCNIDANKP